MRVEKTLALSAPAPENRRHAIPLSRVSSEVARKRRVGRGLLGLSEVRSGGRDSRTAKSGATQGTYWSWQGGVLVRANWPDVLLSYWNSCNCPCHRRIVPRRREQKPCQGNHIWGDITVRVGQPRIRNRPDVNTNPIDCYSLPSLRNESKPRRTMRRAVQLIDRSSSLARARTSSQRPMGNPMYLRAARPDSASCSSSSCRLFSVITGIVQRSKANSMFL